MISGISKQANTLYPLSHPQLRILYSEELYPNTSMQSVLTSFVLSGEYSIDILSEAINLVIKQTDGLRLRLKRDKREIKQYVFPFEEKPIEYYDFSSDNQGLQNWLHIQSQKPIPLYNSCLYTFAIYKNVEGFYCLFFKAHHIIKDGGSRKILIEGILEAYKSLEKNLAYTLPKASYVALLKGESSYKLSPIFEKHRAFWLDKFQRFASHTRIFDERITQHNPVSKRKRFVFTKEEITEIGQYIGEADTSLFRLFLVNFRLFLGFTYIIFQRISGKQEMVLGAPLNNRSSAAYKEALGMFVNMVPFHLSAKTESTFIDLLNTIKTELKENISSQDYPYDLLIQDIR
ncbi:MAG: condensation domain-containing protein, partial [Bacteroidota bacterium]